MPCEEHVVNEANSTTADNFLRIPAEKDVSQKA
jgi:hypothetical protein